MAPITYLNRLHLGEGVLRELPAELALAGIERPLLVTDPGVVAAGLLEPVLAALPVGMAVAVHDGVPSNPDEASVRAALHDYQKHRADGVIGLGGGSPLDLAKAVALAATHPEGPLARYALVEGGLSRITAAAAPVLAIPTTAGTGSEVSRGALIVMEDGRKLSIGSPHLIPRAAFCDPELTVGLPPSLTAATGMDALAHCIETLCSPRDNPVADAIARDGLRRGWMALPRAVADGGDRAARRDMMLASVQGALAFQKGLGAVHALSHALGGHAAKPHHGMLNAILLPHVLRFNAPALGAALPILAEAMSLPEDAGSISGAIAALCLHIGLPAGLAALGIGEEDLPAAARGATRDHHHQTNPRPAGEADYLALLREAFAA
ncbi:iron-containing alcohol dehydrogenase [Sabulicella rubraurantiaca]|uniref:iron-containing alcohol dehydrogenase n=1 Tax=Sabulicella rubraurantiaca TaxID=2811429 RepID=UPI001A96CBEE|nr:iron-containing alcohol dehydrogenase [Sabulicella rubraurantiaca]